MTKEQDEERILRVWTPVILRASVLTSAVLLIVGLITMGLSAPGFYVERVNEIRTEGRTAAKLDWSTTTVEALHGHPRAILMLGLLVLTLVPIGRVGFTFCFFLKEGDHAFTALTATVLLLLIVGVMLGRVG
jgi:uncharacterized membrane protein